MTKNKLFIDSGAFSAWRLKKPVDIKAYCAWLRDNKDYIEVYVNLDVIIPGDPEAAAHAGYNNLLTMRGWDLNPMPVFHVGESIDWLKRMLDNRCDYIGLSASSLVSRNATDDWYELAWSYLVDRNGDPIVKVHAFGETRVRPLMKFPWHSADASTWLNGQKYGYFHMPGGKKINHSRVPAHTKSLPDVGMLEGEDAAFFADILKGINLDMEAFDDRGGEVSWVARAFVSACAFKALETAVNAARPIRYKAATGLLTGPAHSDAKAVAFDDFRLYMAMGANKCVPAIFQAVGIDKPLVSYFYINDTLSERIKLLVSDPAAGVEQEPYGQYVTLLQKIMKQAA
jgi:hypothetical protein